MMQYYDHFVVPFTIGVIILFSVILYKYVRWFVTLPKSDKQLVGQGILTKKSLSAIGEVVSESLLHRRIFRVNPWLGYMHMSLAFGWFLLILFGWIETTIMLSGEMVPPHVHVFFKFFAPSHAPSAIGDIMGTVMDILLLFVLTGVGFAWFKRLRSKALGLRRTTKHIFWDKVALTSLWFVFPVRLIAESITSGLKHSTTFMTGSLGSWLVDIFGVQNVEMAEPVAWWTYSCVLAIFFVALPFSRYMHIFTEIPLIFLRHYGLKSEVQEKSFDRFQIEACSRCGICIDPCQLQKDAGITDVQSVYFLRDRRYNNLETTVTNNCLMCGRCEAKCPVGIELNTLRLNSREKAVDSEDASRYNYIKGNDTSSGTGRVGYFSGCMTQLTPRILHAMEQIFTTVQEDVWWADRNGGVCCGRPIKLAGDIDAAGKMVEHNKYLFAKHNIDMLVTSCPICLKVFKEDYNLQGIEVLHHSEYIARLIAQGRLTPKASTSTFTYHDPCELGRGAGIYDAPREVIRSFGALIEPAEYGKDALCCGSSLANTEITDKQQVMIATALGGELEATGADIVITACPLCKKAISRGTKRPVIDIAELVAGTY